MGHFAKRGKWGCLVIGILLAAGARQRAAADEIETRQFAIQVDGKPAGQYTMTITKRSGGVESMAGQANVRVRVLIKNYEYSYQGTEHWKDGKLQQMQSSTNDDGTHYDLQAAAEANALRVRVNGQEHTTGGDAWPTTHWKLPASKYHNKAVTLLDADSGKEINAHLHYVGIQQLNVGGQVQNCYHFRVTGGQSPVELWYDGAHRLVQQESTVDRHRLSLRLTGLGRQ